MKLIGIVALFFLFLVQACRKDTVSNVAGNWTWALTATDAAPGPLNPLTPQNSGITQSLNFNQNNWIFTKNNQVVSSGTFTTSTVKNTSTGKDVYAIHYYKTGNTTDSVSYYSVTSDTLRFSNDLIGTFGSGTTIYVKQQN